MMRKGTMLLAVGLVLAMPSLLAAQETRYLQPPEPLLQVFRAPLNPSPSLDPTGKRAILIRQSQFPPIARVAEPYLKLAGVRVEPRNHSRHDRSNGYGIRTCLEGLSVLELASGKETAVSLPAGACPGTPSWSPDGTRFSFDNTTDSGVELWIGRVADGQVRRVEGVKLNTILGGAVQWLGDRPALLVKQVPADLGAAPTRSAVPPGPEIKEAIAGKGEGKYVIPAAIASVKEDGATIVKLSDLGSLNGLGELVVHWGEACGNDFLRVDLSGGGGEVPAPPTLSLLGLAALLGLASRLRNRAG